MDDGMIWLTAALRRVRHDDEGITLVEMMVAILVVGLILAAMASTALASLRSAQVAERVTHATAVGNEVLESLQAIPYDAAALYTTEATNHPPFGGGAFEGEDLVLLPDASPQDPDVPEPERTVTRDGIDYTVQTAIVWVDDPVDGTGGSDTSGEQDYKRFVVDISWQLRGEAHTRRVASLRSPTPGDQPLSVTVAPDVIPLDGNGDNAEPFTIHVVTIEPQASVKVSYFDRAGNLVGPLDLTATSSDKRQWERPFLATEDFPNGETLFEIDGMSQVGNVATTTVGRALFLHDLVVDSIVSVPSELTVVTSTDGAVVQLCDSSVVLTTEVQGALPSDVVDTTVQGTGPFTMEVVGPYLTSGSEETGTVFQYVVATSSLTLVPGVPVTVDVTAQRTVGPTATATGTLDIPVNAVGACS